MGLRFDVNISMLFTELPILERPAAAAAAGFDTIESWWPFPEAVPSAAEVDAFVAAIDDAGVRLEALNFYGGSREAGERGLISLPGRSQELIASVEVLVDLASRTGCRRFNALYGSRLEGVAPEAQDEMATENLLATGELVAAIDGTVLLEPLTVGDNGAYPLTSPAEVAAVVERVERAGGPGNVRLLADFYHLTGNGFSWQEVIDQYLPAFGHVQIADAPGRHQPGTGSIDFPGLFAALDAAGYPGYIGIEYRPQGPTVDSLSWLPVEQRSVR